MTSGARIYNLFPSLVGPIDAWIAQLPRIAAMGFNWIFVNPFHQVGFSGSLYAVQDPYALNPLFRGDARGDGAALERFTQAAADHGLSVMMDLVINHTARDSVLAARHRDWFVREADGDLRSPRCVDPDDPTKVEIWGDLAELDYARAEVRAAASAHWCAVARYHARLGFRGFRADAAYMVPAEMWRAVIAAVREIQEDAVFAAETLGCRPDQVLALAGVGFDYLFNSCKWWDFRAPWLLEQYELYRAIAPTIAFPESHDTARLVADLARAGVTQPHAIEAEYRRRYLFAAMFSTGLMMPIGFEYGFRRKPDVVRTRPSDWETPAFDLSGFIAETNAMKAGLPALNQEGPQRAEYHADSAVLALTRTARDGMSVVTLINLDRDVGREVARPGGREATPGRRPSHLTPVGALRLEPGEMRVFVRAAQGAAHVV